METAKPLEPFACPDAIDPLIELCCDWRRECAGVHAADTRFSTVAADSRALAFRTWRLPRWLDVRLPHIDIGRTAAHALPESDDIELDNVASSGLVRADDVGLVNPGTGMEITATSGRSGQTLPGRWRVAPQHPWIFGLDGDALGGAACQSGS
jgi:hypothetical protein